MVSVSTGHEYIGGTRGSGMVSSAADCGVWGERSWRSV